MKLTVLIDVDAKDKNFIWNNLGLFESFGLKVIDVMETNMEVIK